MHRSADRHFGRGSSAYVLDEGIVIHGIERLACRPLDLIGVVQAGSGIVGPIQDLQQGFLLTVYTDQEHLL